MAPKQSATACLSSSGRVEYADTNYVAFLDKESVHPDFHPLMDFLKISPVSYALTESPTIYAEIVQEMWSTACTSDGQIKLKIKGKSYIITPSVINEALHLPNSNFENLPTDEELVCMLKFIKYAARTWNLYEISRTFLRKEWSFFFDTLSKVFTSRHGGNVDITRFILKIAYSLMYGRTIDMGSLLLENFSKRLGEIGNRSKVIYYARFLMIIANHFCKDLSISERDDTLQVCVRTVSFFNYLVVKNLHAKFKFVLPDHIQAQLSNLSPHSHTTSSVVHDTIEKVGKHSIPSTKVTPPAQSLSGKEAITYVYGKRKKTALPTIVAGRSEENEEATEVNPPKKKTKASFVKSEAGLSDVDPEIPPGFSRDGVLAVDLPFSWEKEKPKSDIRFVLGHTLKTDSSEDIPQDPHHLVNQHLAKTTSVLKSQLVACLTSSGDKLSSSDMVDLANRSYNALRALGDNYTSFMREVTKLIAQHQMLEYAAKKKEKDDRDINAHYIQQEMSLSDVSDKLSGAEEKLFKAETYVEALKLKREELTSSLLKLTEELSQEETRVKTLAAERDQCKEAYSDVKAELKKLDARKEEVHEAFEAFNDQYNSAKDEFERMTNKLLRLV